MQRNTLAIIALLVFVFINHAHAQLNSLWRQTYNVGFGIAVFWDIYATVDGGYILTGSVNANSQDTWILKTDSDGNRIWQATYDFENSGFSDMGRSIIEADNGDFVIGGFSRSNNLRNFFGYRINNAGEVIWEISYHPTGLCDAVIETKNGSFLFAGYIHEEDNTYGFAVNVDGDGEVIWERHYDPETCTGISSIREDPENGYFFAGNKDGVWCLLHVSENGELIWAQEYPYDDATMGTAKSLYRVRGGFTLAGWISDENLNFHNRLMRCDLEGDHIWTELYDNNGTDMCYCHVRTTDDGSILVGEHQDQQATPYLIKTDSAGNLTFQQIRNYTGYFRSCVFDQEGFLIAVGEASSSGVIEKFIPERSGPGIISHIPEELEITVLLGDTIDFSVVALDLQGDSLLYAWRMTGEDEPLSDQDSVRWIFEEEDIDTLTCVVSDGDLDASVSWIITVSDFFIRQNTPDTLHITARRGNTIPFTIDVACVEPNEPTVEWSTINRDNDREYLGEADSIDVLFDLAGEWTVEAEAVWGEQRESVRWAVDVRSAVWWWMPHEDAISVNQHEHREFSVFPFDPDSDSLSVGWWLDGDSLDCVAEALSLDFPDLGEHSLTTIVHDGIEADTIHWQITVNDGSSASDLPTTPTKLALYPPAPNPFNSTTTIGYSLPAAGNVSLAMYDLAGREVARLVDGVKPAGTHEAVWVADGVSSGVYVVKLVVGGKALMSKVVLVR